MVKRTIAEGLICGLVIAGALSLARARIVAADEPPSGILLKTQLAEGNYCHLKFPAIRPSTLGTDRPQLKSATTGDIVDYYGPCDHDPLGPEEVARQLHGNDLGWDRSHNR